MSKRILRLILLLFITAAAAAQPLQLGLEMSPATTLPAIPVSFRLTFTNGGQNAVAIPKYALLLVIPASGHRFAALWGGRRLRCSTEMVPSVRTAR